MENQLEKVEVSRRNLEIFYNIDKMCIGDIAHKLKISYSDVKQALRAYGISVRKGEVEPEVPAKTYYVHLTDLNMNLSDVPRVSRKVETV